MAAVRPPCPSFSPTEDSPLSVPLLSVSVSWSVLHRREAKQGGGALLGRLAQLYLLLDDPSRVVDERVDQAGHCGRTTRRGNKSGTGDVRVYSGFRAPTNTDTEALTCKHASDNGTNPR